MSVKEDIITPLIENLTKRIKIDKPQNYKIDLREKPDVVKKKFLILLLQSCVNQSQEAFSLIKNLINGAIAENELINFIKFCQLNIQAQEEAFKRTNFELNDSNERYEYLSKLYEASENDMIEISEVHNPANSFEEIEFRKAKRTDKVERTFQHMINDMIYLVDYLNRNQAKKKK